MNFEYIEKAMASLVSTSATNMSIDMKIEIFLKGNSLVGYGYVLNNKGINVSKMLKLTGENPSRESYDMLMEIWFDLENAILVMESM